MNLRHTSVFHANRPQAQAVAELFYFDLITAAVIFVTVATLILSVSARFRQRPGPRSLDCQLVGQPGHAWTVGSGIASDSTKTARSRLCLSRKCCSWGADGKM